MRGVGVWGGAGMVCRAQVTVAAASTPLRHDARTGLFSQAEAAVCACACVVGVVLLAHPLYLPAWPCCALPSRPVPPDYSTGVAGFTYNYYEDLTTSDVKAIVDTLRKGGKPTVRPALHDTGLCVKKEGGCFVGWQYQLVVMVRI